eukprot:TRINITY_DN9790_c1_g1_i2.p2 TRINITY_DN9790_c1_g1~~TRINITY_DN9790_c1_g1_i2.p2  ORF type:complete len:108 (+),score=16.96 TRINITY_DN9790_c1_g1_i2:2145-2468(+)
MCYGDLSRTIRSNSHDFRCYRAYATYPKAVKNIFHVRNLHLGHLAKAFGLRTAPHDLKLGNQVKKGGSAKKKPVTAKAKMMAAAKRVMNNRSSEFAGMGPAAKRKKR